MAKQYESYSNLQKSQIVSAVKRLNERMRELERNGLTGTNAYKNLRSWVASFSPDQTQVDKKGVLRVKQSYKMTPSQVRRTMAISGNTKATAGWEMKNALKTLSDFKSFGNLSQSLQKRLAQRIANMHGDLHEFIIHHTEAYYGTELHTATKRSGKLTRSEELQFYKLMQHTQVAEELNRQNAMRWIEEQEQSFRG